MNEQNVQIADEVPPFEPNPNKTANGKYEYTDELDTQVHSLIDFLKTHDFNNLYIFKFDKFTYDYDSMICMLSSVNYRNVTSLVESIYASWLDNLEYWETNAPFAHPDSLYKVPLYDYYHAIRDTGKYESFDKVPSHQKRIFYRTADFIELLRETPVA